MIQIEGPRMATDNVQSAPEPDRAEVDISIRNALAQYELIETVAAYHATAGSRPFLLSAQLVKEIHRRGQFYLREDAGEYRRCRVV